MRMLALAAILIAVIIAGCSNGGGTPTLPENSANAIHSRSHGLMGLWQFTANPADGSLEFVPIRVSEMHMNVLPFLEPPPLLNLTIESVEFNGNIIETDIGLRHPFLGLTEFTGFDVCGILISNGSVNGFDDPGLRMAGEGDMRLLNPDGLSRWWNPAEFPVNDGTIFAYNDGLLGAPNSFADFNCTLNAYKYYCDDLDPDDPLSDVGLADRGVFSAGQKNVRHYTLDMGTAGLIFNYAVDACWRFPEGSSPWSVPDDFPEGANREEAWRVEVAEVDNTLWNDGAGSGGGLQLSIDVYDWFNAGMNTVKIESPGNFTIAASSLPIGGGAGYSTYEIEITDATPDEGAIDILISVESEVDDYGGLLPGETVTAYSLYSATVADEPPNIIFVDDSNTSGTEDGTMAHPYNTIQEGVDAALVDYTVLVDDSGNAYFEEVEMKSDIILKSENWDDSDGTGRAFIDGPDVDGAHSVLFDNVDNATITGFRIGFTGEPMTSISTEMIYINLCSNILVEDCYFSGQTNVNYVMCIHAVNTPDLVIANCRMSELDRGTSASGCLYMNAVYADTCLGLVVRNNIVSDIRLTSDDSMKNIDAFWFEDSNNIVIKNNLIHNISPEAPGNANMQKVIYVIRCQNTDIRNNTVDVIDTTVAFFINQCFAYWFEYCGTVTFTNNIATRIYASGFPPPLARGVCAYYNSYVTGDYTDTWDIGPGSMGINYHSGGGGTSAPGVGAIDANPQYIDPDNENHDFPLSSPAQQGDPSFVDWDDTGSPSNDPDNTDTNTRSRMGAFGGPGGEYVGLLT